jgi:hypothetical protein
MRLIFRWTHEKDKLLYQNQIVYQCTLPNKDPDYVVEQLLKFRVQDLYRLQSGVYVQDVLKKAPELAQLAQALERCRESMRVDCYKS